MSLNSNKKKGRTNTNRDVGQGRRLHTENSKIGRPKGLSEKNLALEGVYSNARFMHVAASLVGCVVQVQVKNGNVYEGVFRTFSHQLDLVLEMTHKVDKKAVPAVGVGHAVSSLLSSFTSPDGVTEKLIFKLHDVVMLSAVNVDLDYATRDNFTDTGISKFNGQVVERELEPWDGPVDEVDGLTGLDPDGEDSNGWDVDDMFKTNAEKYGVKTSYDNTLLEYTVPLERKNTEEYKKQEAKASKIAQEIEGSANYQTRIAMENGDEEERFSSVIRPDSLNSSRTLAQRRRTTIQGAKRVVSASGPSPIHAKTYPPQYSISTPSTTQGPPYKSNSLPSQNCVSSPSPTPVSTPVTKQSLTPPSSHSQQPQQRSGSPGQPSAQPVPKELNEPKVNGEEPEREVQKSVLVTQVKDTVPKPPPPVKQAAIVSSQPLPPRPERISDKCRDADKKVQRQKGHDNGIEELIKFGTIFKLSEESKEVKEHKEEPQKSDQSLDQTTIPNKHIDQQKDKEKEVEKIKDTEIDKCATTVRNSTLNPNAKEFVFNPNAKSFTPRSLAVASPISPVPLQPPRMHTQSPVMALPQHQMVPGMAQPIFTAMTPQYVMSPTPVSVSLTPPFASPASIQQAPRFRKIPLTMPPRHDLSPSVHVAAATGQPILAPAALHTPQLTMQYTPPPGMIPTPGPPQAAMAYPQMYSMVGPRVMSPQPVGLVPTSHTATYGDTHHIPAHLYMSPHPGTALSAVPTPHAVPVSAVPQGATGSHSNPPTPQSQTPGMHAAPSPVHQPPPNVTPAQTPTPTGHPGSAPTPQPVVYHGPMTQHPLQPGPHNPNTPPSQNHHVAHVTQPHPHSSFTGAPQPVVLMPQQAVPGPHVPHPGSIPSSGPHALQGHPIHGQTPGSHAGTPTHVLPPMTVIPTSAAMVPAPAPFAPHPQGV